MLRCSRRSSLCCARPAPCDPTRPQRCEITSRCDAMTSTKWEGTARHGQRTARPSRRTSRRADSASPCRSEGTAPCSRRHSRSVWAGASAFVDVLHEFIEDLSKEEEAPASCRVDLSAQRERLVAFAEHLSPFRDDLSPRGAGSLRRPRVPPQRRRGSLARTRRSIAAWGGPLATPSRRPRRARGPARTARGFGPAIRGTPRRPSRHPATPSRPRAVPRRPLGVRRGPLALRRTPRSDSKELRPTRARTSAAIRPSPLRGPSSAKRRFFPARLI